MADTFTPHYNLTKPQVGGDPDTWGGLLNANFDTIDSQLYTASTYALPLAGGTLTGPVTINQTASQFALTIGSAGTTGAGFKLIGDGPTTPSKYIRARGGNLEFINDGNSAIIATMTDVGGLTLGGTLSVGGNLTVSGATTFSGTPTVNSSTAEADLFLQYGGAVAHRVYMSNSSTSTRFGLNYTDASGNYAGTGLAMDNTNGAVSIPTTLSVTGVITGGSDVKSSQNFLSTSANWVSAPNGAGTIYFRPNGVGSTTNQTYVASDGIWHGVDFQATSDLRLKEHVRKLRRGLDELKRMLPREYIKGGKEEVGFIAQEVQQVLPEAVSEGVDGMLSVSHGQLVALLAAAILDIDRRLQTEGI